MSKFDHLLLHVDVGVSRKLRRLSVEERWCAVAGVWALAAKSPERGYLLITSTLAVTEEDIAEQAGVKLSVARSTLAKLRELGMLESDEELGAEHVHDWHDHQHEPKQSESPEAWRERKRRQREAARLAAKPKGNVPPPGPGGVPRDVPRSVTPARPGSVTPPKRREEKRREENYPPDPPKGGRQRDRDLWAEQMAAWISEHPVTDELAERVDDVLGLTFGEYPDARMHLGQLHGHAESEHELIVGVPSHLLGWIGERWQKWLDAVAGKPVRIIDCRCDHAAAERAA